MIMMGFQCNCVYIVGLIQVFTVPFLIIGFRDLKFMKCKPEAEGLSASQILSLAFSEAAAWFTVVSRSIYNKTVVSFIRLR